MTYKLIFQCCFQKNGSFYFFDEIGIIHVDDRLNDSSVDIGDVDTQEGSHHQKDGQGHQIEGLSRIPFRNHNFNELHGSFEEDHIDLSLALFNLFYGY